MRSDTITRDGILLTGIYHCLMGVFFMIVTAAVIRFGMLATQNSGTTDILFAVIAAIAGLVLTTAYVAIAAGVFGRREWSRIGGIVLSILGVGAGLLVVFQAVASAIQSMQPDWSTVIAYSLLAAVLYILIALFDLAVLLFLVSPRTRAAFTGAAYPVSAPDSLSPLELIASRVLRNTSATTSDE